LEESLLELSNPKFRNQTKKKTTKKFHVKGRGPSEKVEGVR